MKYILSVRPIAVVSHLLAWAFAFYIFWAKVHGFDIGGFGAGGAFGLLLTFIGVAGAFGLWSDDD